MINRWALIGRWTVWLLAFVLAVVTGKAVELAVGDAWALWLYSGIVYAVIGGYLGGLIFQEKRR